MGATLEPMPGCPPQERSNGQDGRVSASAEPTERWPLGFAHRGARSEARDNTIGSFARALELGAPGLESDAWSTADDQVVLDHDGLVRRGLRRYRIGRLRRDELPRHIPTLAELYHRFGTDFSLSLDVKDPSVVSPVLDLAAEIGGLGRLWLCHPDARSLVPVAAGRARLVESTSLGRISEPLEMRAGKLAAAGVSALNLRSREWTATAVETVHSAGLRAFAWDAQRSSELHRVLNAGVDAVFSDHVQRMVKALAEIRWTG
jgi:glycerophosphoryl diester phosphodiesterase